MRYALVVALAVLFSGVVHATDANLDPSFGSFGWTSVNPTPGFDAGNAVAIQPDGRILVAGSGFSVRRFTTAGSLDPTFGTGGTVTTFVGPDGYARAIALQADGRIVVAGAGNSSPTVQVLVAARYAPDGTLDTSFGTGGIVMVTLVPAFEVANAVAIQADGSILLVGGSSNGAVNGAFVVRLLADGTVDAGFGAGGSVVVATPGAATAQDVAVQPDGKIVVGGYAWVPTGSSSIQAFMLARFAADGSPDAGFATGGVRIDGPGPEGSRLGSAVALQPDGKIVLGGSAGSYPAALRYLADGSLDAGFGTGGLATAPFGFPRYAGIFDMVLRPDGKIVLIGSVSPTGGLLRDTALVRFDSDGTPDATFAPGGHVDIVIGSRQSVALSGARQSDGKIVVTGYRTDAATPIASGDTALFLARFGGSCGNAFLDAGEECDDGNTDGHDCCSAGCGYDPPGQECDTADTSVCTRDVCDGAGSCQVGGPWPASDCLAVTQPGKSSLAVKDSANDQHDALKWRWTGGPEVFNYGTPNVTTQFSFCLFGGSTLLSESVIPPGPDWRAAQRTWRLRRDPATAPAGIRSVTLREGIPGKSKIALNGKGPLLGPPTAPLPTPVTAQLVSPEGLCFGASYASPTMNANGQFKGNGQ